MLKVLLAHDLYSIKPSISVIWQTMRYHAWPWRLQIPMWSYAWEPFAQLQDEDVFIPINTCISCVADWTLLR